MTSKPLLLLPLLAATSTAAVIVDTTPPNNRANLTSQAGQTFTTGVIGAETALSSITIITASAISGSDPTGPFTLKLFADVDGNFSTWDPGAELAASTNTASLTPAGSAVVFLFAGEVLADNTVYAISFNNGANDHVAFRSALTNNPSHVITDGALFSGGSQPFSGAYDMSFRVETTFPATSEIPEPVGSGMLAALVCGTGLLVRRRGRA